MVALKIKLAAFENAPEKAHEEMIKEHFRELFEGLGLKIEEIDPNILRKLLLLNERTKTFEDEERSLHLAERFFEYYESEKPAEAFTEDEQRTVLLGTMFTDIGKTGPKNATPEQEEAILSIYAVEAGFDPKKVILKDFLNQYFPEDAGDRLAALEGLGISGEMTMREFYNLHAGWTHEIIKDGGIPPEAVVAAASHHVLEGVNPVGIDEHGKYTKYSGEDVAFDKPEKLVILLDKYDASRRRGHQTHEKAIEWLEQIVDANKKFSKDKEFHQLIDGLDGFIATHQDAYAKDFGN